MSEMEPERSKEYLQPILRNARRLQTLINDILDVTRIESQSLNLNKERVNLDDVISSLLVDYLNQIERERNQKDINWYMRIMTTTNLEISLWMQIVKG